VNATSPMVTGAAPRLAPGLPAPPHAQGLTALHSGPFSRQAPSRPRRWTPLVLTVRPSSLWHSPGSAAPDLRGHAHECVPPDGSGPTSASVLSVVRPQGAHPHGGSVHTKALTPHGWPAGAEIGSSAFKDFQAGGHPQAVADEPSQAPNDGATQEVVSQFPGRGPGDELAGSALDAVEGERLTSPSTRRRPGVVTALSLKDGSQEPAAARDGVRWADMTMPRRQR
jgi:hypothetical protein